MWGRFQHQDTGASFSGHQGGAQRGVAATNYQHIWVHCSSFKFDCDFANEAHA
jgi:hypothetical protein